MDPINSEGTIAPFHLPRHGYPLIAGGILKPVSSLAYVDDATRFVALPKGLHTIEEFFVKVQGYCDLLADLSLVIKMGRNVNKCTILLYNIPEDADIPEFTSIAWSYDARGPVKGSIKTIVMHRDSADRLLCYQVPENLRPNAPQPIRDILMTHKYLGVPSNAQLDGEEGREKILRKLQQRIGLIASKSNSVTETKIAHNMLVCQVATFSPICISFTLQECMAVDKQLVKAYQYCLKHMPSDAKHNTFISEKRGGMGLRSFTREYVGALMRDIEVYISNADTLPAHALWASIEAATKQCLWAMNLEDILPPMPALKNAVQQLHVSAKCVIWYDQTFDAPKYEEITYNHTHVMGRAIQTTALMGFMLRDLDHELCSRFTDELLISDNHAKTSGSPSITNRAKLGAIIGEGNRHFAKYSLTGRIYLIVREIIHQAGQNLIATTPKIRDNLLQEKLSRPALYTRAAPFPGEFSALRLASCARQTIAKLKEDYRSHGFYNLIEWRVKRADVASTNQTVPKPTEYKTIIDDSNAFNPLIYSSMQQNSTDLAEHLYTVLRLQVN